MKVFYTLNRVFTVEFYKLNSAFFLLVLGLSFGFMSGVEHRVLAQFFISSPTLLLIPFSGWLLYAIKIIRFNRATLHLPQNEFIFQFTAFNKHTQWIYVFPVLFIQLLPAIAYGIFLSIVAIQNAVVQPVFYMLFYLLVLIAISTFAFIHRVNYPHPDTKVTVLKKLIDRNFTKPYFQFFILWVSRREMGTLLGTKLFSCLLLWGVTNLYDTDTYDSRLLALAITIAFAANVMLVYHFHQFENSHFSIARNLPIRLWKRIFYFATTFTFLCLPEFGLFLNNSPATLGFATEISIMAFGLSIIILQYTYLYRRNMTLERFIKHVFGITIIFIVMVLFSVPVWLIAIANIAIGSILFQKNYYRFEFT